MMNLTFTLKAKSKRALYNNISLSLFFNEQIFSNILLLSHISLTNVQKKFINHTNLKNFNNVKRKKQTVSLTKQSSNELSTYTTQHK